MFVRLLQFKEAAAMVRAVFAPILTSRNVSVMYAAALGCGGADLACAVYCSLFAWQMHSR